MTIDTLLDKLCFSHCYTTDRDHCRLLYEKAKQFPGGQILELGSHQGISTCFLALAAKETGATVYALDLCNEVKVETRLKLWKSLGLDDVIFPIEDDSTQFLEQVAADGGSYDMVFHDARHGDHIVYEYILALVITAPEGTLAIHDFEQISAKPRARLIGESGKAFSDYIDSKGRAIAFFEGKAL